MLEVATGERDGDVEVGGVVNVGDGSVEAAREKGADLERGELFESEGDSVVGGSGLAVGCGGMGVERGARRAINWTGHRGRARNGATTFPPTRFRISPK